MKFYTFFTLLLLGFSTLSAQEGYRIEIEIDDYDNDTLIIGNQFTNKQIVTDTLMAIKKGKFLFAGPDTLSPGIYIMLMKPGNEYNQFIVSEDNQHFEIKADKDDRMDVEFEDSEENEIFYEYLDFLESKRAEMDLVKSDIEKHEAEGLSNEKLMEKSDKIDREVLEYQTEIQKKHPESITALLVKANTEIELPEFDGSEEEQKRQRYFYFKKHYFDHVDLAHPAAIRLPYQFEKINTYMENLTTPMPDSIIKSVDYILDKLSPDPESFRYYVSFFLRKYAEMKIVGMDAVYVHIIDEYYSKGKTPWIDQENLEALMTQANNLRGTLIGKTFPPIVTYMADSTPVAVRVLDAEYTVLVFWKPGCGHCAKAMPHINKFNETYQDRNIKVVTICTLQGDKADKCWDGVKEKNMENLINTGDPHQRYRTMVYIPSTPKIFILDKDKKIIMKDIPGDKLEVVMEDILKFKADENSKTD